MPVFDAQVFDAAVFEGDEVGGGGGGQRPGDSGAGSGTAGPSAANYFLRVEYTTYEFDADDEVEICIVDPVCAVCGGTSGSGDSGASGGNDTGGLCPPGLVPDGNGNCVYVGPCNCPPGFSLFLVGITPDFQPIYQCKSDFGGLILRNCNEDPRNPGNGGGGGSGGGGAVPSLTVELTTFEVPAGVTAVSVRCVDVTTCEVCA